MTFSNAKLFSLVLFLISIPFSSSVATETYVQGVCTEKSPEGKIRTLEELENVRCWYGTNKSDVIDAMEGKVSVNLAAVGDYRRDYQNEFYGLGGDDQIFGGDYNDYIYGGRGQNDLTGGGGNDILSGSKKGGILRGDTGRDTYVNISSNNKLIIDKNDKFPRLINIAYFDDQGYRNFLNCYREEVYEKGESDRKAKKTCGLLVFIGAKSVIGKFNACRNSLHVKYAVLHAGDSDDNSSFQNELDQCFNEMINSME